LAAGLIWSLIISNSEFAVMTQQFFLICIVVAGIFGAMTANKRIFMIQSMPALIALVLILSK
jgi:putative membrane protein